MKCIKSSMINKYRINCSLELNHEGKCNFIIDVDYQEQVIHYSQV